MVAVFLILQRSVKRSFPLNWLGIMLVSYLHCSIKVSVVLDVMCVPPFYRESLVNVLSILLFDRF